MNTSTLSLVGLLVIVAGVGSANAKTLPIPPYITPCSRNEPDIGACILKRGRETIPHIIGGDKKYKIPAMDPLKINRIHIDEGVLGLNFTANNVNIIGLRDAIFTRAEIDFAKGVGVYALALPWTNIQGKYKIGGRILVLPIQGDGHSNITLINSTVVYTYYFKFFEKDGDKYTTVTKSDLKFDTARLYIHLDNLFNGNKLLGDEMNRFMNENWKEMVKELGPVIGQAIGEVMRRTQSNVFELVSYDEAFPDIPV